MSTTGRLYSEIWRDHRWEPVPQPKYSKGKRLPVLFMAPGTPYELYAALVGFEHRTTYHFGHTEPIIPISEPRGFPEDMNSIYQEYFRENCVPPSRYLTWFMVQEVIDYDWDKKFPPCIGYVKNEYAALFEPSTSFPDNFPEDESIYWNRKEGTTRIVWTESYREFVGCADWFIAELMKLGDPEKSRIIFWLE